MAHLTSVIIFVSLAITSSEGQVSSGVEVVSVCSLSKFEGPCRAAFKRFFFNSATGQCEEFTYGGCQGNDNNFSSLEECSRQCPPTNVCDQPKVVGPCRALIPRYFYNKVSKNCEEFHYGGCQGNGNNFERLEDCTKQCQPVNACDQPKVTGPCRAAFPRYYYNATTETCERFTYGGCQGNENNFETHEDCSANCLCNLPAQAGRCRAYIPSWFFDTETGSCESFVYGGCEGNGNRFGDQQTCEDVCDVCSLPKKIGPCDGAFPRWYYNSNAGLCQQFSYGGCDGNANNFESESACKRSCQANISSFWTHSFGNLF